MKSIFKFLTLIFIVSNYKVLAQANIKVTVLGVSAAGTFNCDGGADNSDFVFEFAASDNSVYTYSNNSPVAGSIGMCNYVVVNNDNGPYISLPSSPGNAVFVPSNGVFFDHTYNCKQELPASIVIKWTAYENDDVTAPSVTPVANGTVATQSYTIAVPTAGNTYTTQYTAISTDGSCGQTYHIAFMVERTNVNFEPLKIAFTDGNEICTGTSTGELETFVVGGSGIVQLDWSNDGVNDFDDNSTVSGVPAGTYTLIVKDALNCRDTSVAVVTETDPPQLINAFTDSVKVVCTNQTGVLYAVPGQSNVTYNWSYTGAGAAISSSGNAASINFMSNATTGTLSVYAQNACSVTPAHTMLVTVNQSPSLSITGASSACNNTPVELTASGAATYTWSNNAATNSITVNPGTTTVYTVTGESASGCVSVAQHTLNVLPTPTLQITGSTLAVCPGETVAVTASGNGSLFLWSDGFIGASHTLSATATTIYTVTHTYTNSCFTQETYTLHVSPLPSISITGTANVCAGQLFTVTANGADTYTWNNGAHTATITDGVFGPVTFSVSGTNTLTGCSNTQTVVADVYPAAAVAITGNSLICSNTQEVYQVTGADFYLWDNGATASTNTITVTGATTISVVGTTIHGCKDSTNYTIGIVTTPTITILGSDSICNGQSTVLSVNALGASSYTWSTGAITSSITVNPSLTNTYSVVSINGACADSATHQVYVKPMPFIGISGTNAICSGQTANITVTALALSTYSWSNGASGASVAVSPVATEIYSVTVTKDLCAETHTFEVQVTTTPSVSITGNDTICVGQGAFLNANVQGTSIFNWNTGATTSAIAVSPATTTTYTVFAVNGSCTSSASHEVYVKPLPQSVLSGNDSICAGQSAVIDITALAGSTYSWSNGATTSSVTVSPATTEVFTVTVSNHSCSEVQTFQVHVTPLPVVSISGNDTICEGQTVMLTANATGGVNYNWNTGATSVSVSNTPALTTIYSVTVSTNGCSTPASHEVVVKPVPAINFNMSSYSVCTADAILNFSATPTGGTYSGPGVSGQTFNPSTGAGSYPVVYQITAANGCLALQTQTITVSDCVGLKEYDHAFGVTVYPNPAKDYVRLSSTMEMKEVTIFDYTGKLVRTEMINATEKVISLDNLTGGLYTLVLKGEGNALKTVKVIKE